MTFPYEVQYKSVNSGAGYFAEPCLTLKEAQAEVKRLKAIIKEPGYAAWGIKIVKINKETK